VLQIYNIKGELAAVEECLWEGWVLHQPDRGGEFGCGRDFAAWLGLVPRPTHSVQICSIWSEKCSERPHRKTEWKTGVQI